MQTEEIREEKCRNTHNIVTLRLFFSLPLFLLRSKSQFNRSHCIADFSPAYSNHKLKNGKTIKKTNKKKNYSITSKRATLKCI